MCKAYNIVGGWGHVHPAVGLDHVTVDSPCSVAPVLSKVYL